MQCAMVIYVSAGFPIKRQMHRAIFYANLQIRIWN